MIGTYSDGSELIELNITPYQVSSLIDSLLSPLYGVSVKEISSVAFRSGIAHLLYKQLIEPIEKKLSLPNKIIIVPDIKLVNLPFEFLLRCKEKGFGNLLRNRACPRPSSAC